MASAGEVGEELRRIVAALPVAVLQHAATLLDEAATVTYQATAGSSSWEPPEIVAGYGLVREQIDEALRGVDRWRSQVLAQAEQYGGNAGSPPAAPVPSVTKAGPAPPSVAADHDTGPVRLSRERVAELIDALPPTVQRGSGAKTHGLWLGPDGQARPITSGRGVHATQVEDYLRDMKCPRRPLRASDVEMKLAAYIRTKAMQDGRTQHLAVTINYTPCKGELGCDTLVPILLPEGSTLTVYGTGGFCKTYTGGATPWWQ